MLENDYLYCPYCGTPFHTSGEEFADLVEEPLQELELQVQESTLARLSKLEKVLVNLEKDLDDFLAKS